MSSERQTLGAVVGVGSVLAIAAAVYSSLDPANYFFYGFEDRSLWVYPTGHVAFVCLFMLLEGILVAVVLVGPWRKSLATRSVVGLCVMVPWAVVSAWAVIHMPLYVLIHHLWLWSLVALLLALLLFGGARALRSAWFSESGGSRAR